MTSWHDSAITCVGELGGREAQPLCLMFRGEARNRVPLSS